MYKNTVGKTRILLVKRGGRITSSFARASKYGPALSSGFRSAMTMYVEKRSYLASYLQRDRT
jgi:hypothetical protein